MRKLNLSDIEKKWQKKWEESKVFEANPDKRKKFFVNFPYPYVNGYLHMGHLFSSLRVDAIARYKRLKGYNVLYPQGFHATGQPIVAAANRVKDGEKKQIEILKMMGIPSKDIKKFEKPEHWVEFFTETSIKDLKKSGSSIDWRRSFITTEMNPSYDSFVRWQFNKLNDGGYISKGTHPVVWCPNDQQPLGDHDRAKGEGVNPEEVVLIKFRSEDGKIFPAMTFRPETTYGVTNMWVNPEGEYAEVIIDKETWIISQNSIESFEVQGFKPVEKGPISGKDLIGLVLKNPVTNDRVKILPASFVRTDNGTGIVMSVPAHAPYDYIAVRDLREKEHELKKFNLSKKDVDFDFISLIKVEGYGEYPAKDIVERMKIKDQSSSKLKEATKEIYKKEFHQGILKDIFGKHKGMKVMNSKEILIHEFLNKGYGVKFFVLTEEVVCRCLTKAIVGVIDNQYFLNYSDPEWKEKAHECVSKMRFYPPETKANYHYTIDWLRDWACARDKGMGTRLPWDEKWLIESLSDSTIYMAYYTIAHYIEGKKGLKDSLFDYVFLGKGSLKDVAKENGISDNILKSMRKEFLYWYDKGYDFRNSGKDLIQNHLTFSIFHHVAIFPKKHWPSGISVNGHIMLDNEKMSKSKGNFITFGQAIEKYGVDATRFTTCIAGDASIDDANFETSLASTFNSKLENMIEFASENYNKGVEDYRSIDAWMDSKINEIIKKTDYHYDNAETRSALQTGYYEMQRILRWYTRRTSGVYNKNVINRFIEVQALILSPAIPHTCEEIWSLIGKKGFISSSEWPSLVKVKEKNLDVKEKMIETIIDDVNSIVKLVGRKPKKIQIFVSKNYKYDVYSLASKMKDRKNLMKEAMNISEVRKNGKDASKYIQSLMSRHSFDILLSKKEELRFLEENKDFISKEFDNIPVDIVDGDVTQEDKARRAEPMKPGIIVM